MPGKKKQLSGLAFDMMQPGIDFGPSATLHVFARMHIKASEMDPAAPVIDMGRSGDPVTAKDIIDAIDFFVPLEDGQRTLSDMLDLDNRFDTNPAARHLETMAHIQSHVWMKFEDEIPDFLGREPKDIWHAIQYMEYISRYEPIDPDTTSQDLVSIEGMVFAKTGDRIQIHNLADTPQGELMELTSTSAVLPQYYAVMDETGLVRDLRNDNYSIVEPEVDEDISFSM